MNFKPLGESTNGNQARVAFAAFAVAYVSAM